jgi:divalent metal cation (Fe/Co/Zn/Cd) transporter
MSEHKMKPIWYFVGLILVIMGGLIIMSGAYQLVHPPSTPTVLAEIHPNLWWGTIMMIFGGVMYWKTRR